MRVVLLVPTGTASASLERLIEIARDNDEFILITAAPTDVVHADVVRVGSDALPPRNAITRTLSRSAVGRNLLRLTSWDGGRRFASALARNEGARAVLQHADIVVALERDGILAAWHAGHHARETSVLYGVAAARAVISRDRG